MAGLPLRLNQRPPPPHHPQSPSRPPWQATPALSGRVVLGRPPTLKWRTAITLDLTSNLPATGEEGHWPLVPTTPSTAGSPSDQPLEPAVAPKGGQPCKKTALYKIAPPSDQPAPAATPLADQAALEVSSIPKGGQTCKKTPLYEIAPPSDQPAPHQHPSPTRPWRP